MPKHLSITHKMIIAMLLLSFLATLSTLGPALYQMDRYISKESQSAAIQGVNGLQYLLEEQKKTALNFSEEAALHPPLIAAISQKDTAAVLQIMNTFLKHTNIDFVTITDETGRVIARTHEPNKKGDSVISQANVASALKGTSFAAIESGTAVKLSARAGVPVKNEAGTIVGVISAGFDVSNGKLVDQAKQIFQTDMTIFLNDVRASTTIFKDGQRIIGTKLNEQIAAIVLQQGQSYSNKTEILGLPYYTSYQPLYGPNQEIIGVLFSGQELQASIAQRNQMLSLIAIIWLVVLLLSFLLIIFLAKKLLQPINDLIRVIEHVAGGDLTTELQVHSKDELETLARHFNTMITALKTLLKQVHHAEANLSSAAHNIHLQSSQSANASDQVAQSVTNVASAAQRQLSFVVNTAKTVQTMSAEIDAAAGKTENVALYSDKTTTAAREGNTTIEQAMQQMTAIENSVQGLGEVISQLDAKSLEIGSIIQTIGEISRQTNLLALNAAIEAARAGEQGKGFAVVAEEVRKLAEESTRAAGSIGTLVDEIQIETKSAVQAMQKSSAEVRAGTEIFSTTGKSFHEILAQIESILERVTSISSNMKMLSDSSHQVMQEIGDIEGLSKNVSSQTETISAATEQQAASMTEMASYSDNLLSMSQELKDALQKFKM